MKYKQKDKNMQRKLDEFEHIQGYEPKAWNKFSEVEPPVETPLRVKIFHKSDKTLSRPIYMLCGFYHKETNEIVFPFTNVWEHEQVGEILFRPWED